MCSIATRPLLPSSLHIGMYCKFTVQVQVCLVLIWTVTGPAVLYVVIAGITLD